MLLGGVCRVQVQVGGVSARVGGVGLSRFGKLAMLASHVFLKYLDITRWCFIRTWTLHYLGKKKMHMIRLQTKQPPLPNLLQYHTVHYPITVYAYMRDTYIEYCMFHPSCVKVLHKVQ